MAEKLKILVTGEPDDGQGRLPERCSPAGPELEWVQLPVLEFQPLPVDPAVVKTLCERPVDWILFTSPRAVEFWTACLLENGADFPLETQVGCIGETTAEMAERDGFTPDFYPTEPGSEKFVEEFADLLSNRSDRPRVFIPMAEGGRTWLAEKLREMGCDVTMIPLYRTRARAGLGETIRKLDLGQLKALLFTSPSSVDAFTAFAGIPGNATVVAIGRYTGDYLASKGYKSRLLPGGDFHRIGEVL